MNGRTASSLDAAKAEFEEILDKLDRALVKGNKLTRELVQIKTQAQRLVREISALWKKIGKEHASEPDLFTVFAEMLAKLQAVRDRNPDPPDPPIQ
jgi:septal ring factor EnvC (AmiA/AmiB activator)